MDLFGHSQGNISAFSAYCGCLWLAALRAALVMAREVGDSACAHRYAETLSRAREAYITKLWNGEYYNFDERSRSRHTIMADQLCGYWFLQSISPELADEVFLSCYAFASLMYYFVLEIRF